MKSTPIYDYGLFLLRCLRHPRKMGAILPSSRSLAKLMVRAIHQENHTIRVLELGAGTGGLTRELLEAGVQPAHLCIIEIDPVLCGLLRQKYPHVTVIEGSACDAETLLPEAFKGAVDVVISGIPIRNLDKKTKNDILDASFKVLKPSGVLLQFTYGFSSPWPTHTPGLSSEKVGSTLCNIPPAAVWRYHKMEAVSQSLG